MLFVGERGGGGEHADNMGRNLQLTRGRRYFPSLPGSTTTHAATTTAAIATTTIATPAVTPAIATPGHGRANFPLSLLLALLSKWLSMSRRHWVCR